MPAHEKTMIRSQIVELVLSGLSHSETALRLNLTKGQVTGHWYRYLSKGEYKPTPPRRCRLCDTIISRQNISDLCLYHRIEQRRARDNHIATPSQTAEPVSGRYLLSDIIALSAEAFGVSVNEIKGPRRMQSVVSSRQCIALIARTLTGMSYPRIGAAMGRDHSTTIHNCRTGQWRFANEPDFCNLVLNVLVRLTPVRPQPEIVFTKAKPAPRPVPKAPVLIKPKPQPDLDWELDDMTALSLAVQRHYAAGRDCLEVY